MKYNYLIVIVSIFICCFFASPSYTSEEITPGKICLNTKALKGFYSERAFFSQNFSEKDDGDEFFPLQEGNYWVYSGIVKWHDGEEICENEVTWKMEVIEVVKNDNITLALLKGYPGDLAWYEEGKEKGNYLIIKKGDIYYRLTYKVYEIMNKFKKDEDISQFLNQSAIFLESPLEEGKIFGDPTTLEREDGCYCWIVDSVENVELKEKGFDIPEEEKQYNLIYRTMPDHTVINFVPSIGITGYEYIHHGTVSETHLKLVECRISSF